MGVLKDPTMTEFHGVFPYLVSPIDAHGRIKTDVLGRLCIRPHRSRRAWADAARLDRRVRLSRRERSARLWCARPSKRRTSACRWSPAWPRPRPPMPSRRRGATSSSAPTASSPSSKPIFRCKDAQVETYFRAIADAVDIPVVLYTNPQFQRSDLTLDVIARLSEHPRIQLHQGCLDQYRAAACRS